jgi:hypothetical protein
MHKHTSDVDDFDRALMAARRTAGLPVPEIPQGCVLETGGRAYYRAGGVSRVRVIPAVYDQDADHKGSS